MNCPLFRIAKHFALTIIALTDGLGGAIRVPVISAIASLALSACAADGTLTPTATNVLKATCTVDGVAQPIAVTLGTVGATVAGFSPEAALAGGIDSKVVHPAIQGACAGLGGTAAPAAIAGGN